MTDYELVVGIETHVQLKTRTKLFCGCEIRFAAPPNTLTCPVCLGHPGTLPVLNGAAFELAMRTGLALNGEIAPYTKFDRKHYFYPDLPKNYQITQYDLPFSVGGWVEIHGGKKIRLVRAHLEEDAGKLTHESTHSAVDLNRTGVPLAEIVTHPDLRTSEETYQYMTALRTILRAAGVSDCDMEKGEMRCDVNLSIRPRGETKLGTKTEIKNLNSFKNAKAALEYEYARHVRVLESGGTIVQETRQWDPEKGETRVMRSKEDAHDYRYFPEPDLPPVRVSKEWIEKVRAQIPELPAEKTVRFQKQYGLNAYDAGVLASDPAMAVFFEKTVVLSDKAKTAANWIANDLRKYLNETNKTVIEIKLRPQELAELIRLVDTGAVTNVTAKKLFADALETGVLVAGDVGRIADDASIEMAAQFAIEANPKAANDFKAGKDAAIKSLVGAVMKATKGRADPKLAEVFLRRML